MSQWKGRISGNSFPQGGSDCMLTLTGNSMIATLPEGTQVAINLATVRFEIRGDKKKELYFLEESYGGTTLTTTDLSLLMVIRRLALPNLEDGFKSNTGNEPKKWSKRVLVPLLLLIGIPLFLLGPGINIIVYFIPTSVDKSLGESFFDSSLADIAGGSPTFIKDPQLLASLYKIVKPLTKNISPKDFKFEIYVVDHPMVNAFALPGGKIIIMKGLLETVNSPEEVAGVLAHEIIHVTHRHGLKKIAKSIGLWSILLALLGDINALSDMIIYQSASLFNSGFSRSMEKDADKNGFLLMEQAGFNPEGLKLFFETLKEEEAKMGASNSKLAELFRSHPLTNNRMKYLDKILEDKGTIPFKPIDIKWKELQEGLKKIK